MVGGCGMNHQEPKRKHIAMLGFALFVGSLTVIYTKVSANDPVPHVQKMDVELQSYNIQSLALTATPDNLGNIGLVKVGLQGQGASLWFDVTLDQEQNLGLGQAYMIKDGAKIEVGAIDPLLMTDLVAQIERKRELSQLNGLGGAV